MNDGTYTFNNLTPGTNYRASLTWYDTKWYDIYSYATTSLIKLEQVETIPANKNAVIRVSSSNLLTLKKWKKGSYDISYFQKGGNTFVGDTFEVSDNGVYTVYAKDIKGNETCERIEIINILPRVLVIVEDSILDDLNDSLQTYKDDLLNEGYYAVIEPFSNKVYNQNIPKYSGNGDVNDLKALIKARYSSWSNPKSKLVGFVLIGDLPYAKVSKEETKTDSYDQYCMSDWYLSDMDGTWIDSNNNGTLDKIKGDIKPELWSGRLYSTSYNHIEQYISYFNRNHLYRNGNLAHSGKACYLGTFDGTIENRNALKDLYSANNTTLFETGDAVECIKGDYEWFDYIAHSSPWWLGDLNYSKIISNKPNILFYNTHACSTARYEVKDYIAGKILFETNALEYIGETCNSHYFPDQDSTFKTSLKNGKTFGEAHKDLLLTRGGSYYSTETSIGIYFGQEIQLFGDPTLKLLK